MDPTPSVRRFGPGEWPALRRLRLRALADAPDAFSRTFAEERDLPDAHWTRMLAAAAASPSELSALAELGGQPAGLVYARRAPEAGFAGTEALAPLRPGSALRVRTMRLALAEGPALLAGRQQ
jgi:hypothetical protein